MRWRRLLPLLAALALPATARTEPIPTPAMPAILPETPPEIPPLPPAAMVVPALPAGLVVEPCASCRTRVCPDVKSITTVAFSTRTVEFCVPGSSPHDPTGTSIRTKRVLVKRIGTEEHRPTVVVPELGLTTVPALPPR